MSLLEDVFLEDEANEAQELERVIEGGEYEERARSDSDDNSEKEDEAEEDKRRVDPASAKNRRVVKNPRFILNPARLTGPRGIQVIPDHYKDFKFKGKGHEKEDLDLILKKLEHWAYRLYPKFKFEDCLKKIETLGKKKPVMVHLHKIRSDQYLSDDIVVQKDSSDDEAPQDEFDKLLQQQIELARATPAPGSVKKNMDSSHIENRIIMPKATSSPSISEEQKERMLRNRKLAEERRLARLKALNDNTNQETNLSVAEKNTEVNNDVTNEDMDVSITKKHAKVNVIESSDEENVNETVSVDVHNHSSDSKAHYNVCDNVNEIKDTQDKGIDEDLTEDNVINESDVNNISQDNSDSFNTHAEKSNKKESNSKSNEVKNTEERSIVLENNLIQSTIQGLVENDNNLNLERDLINQDLGENGEVRNENNLTESAPNDDENNEVNDENLMDVDFSEEF